MEINGILINQPIDKYNHIWDMGRYGTHGLEFNGEIETKWNQLKLFVSAVIKRLSN